MDHFERDFMMAEIEAEFLTMLPMDVDFDVGLRQFVTNVSTMIVES